MKRRVKSVYCTLPLDKRFVLWKPYHHTLLATSLFCVLRCNNYCNYTSLLLTLYLKDNYGHRCWKFVLFRKHGSDSESVCLQCGTLPEAPSGLGRRVGLSPCAGETVLTHRLGPRPGHCRSPAGPQRCLPPSRKQRCQPRCVWRCLIQGQVETHGKMWVWPMPPPQLFPNRPVASWEGREPPGIVNARWFLVNQSDILITDWLPPLPCLTSLCSWVWI